MRNLFSRACTMALRYEDGIADLDVTVATRPPKIGTPLAFDAAIVPWLLIEDSRPSRRRSTCSARPGASE